MRATRVAWRADLFELLCRVLHATARACCTGSSSLAALSATHTTPSTAARLLAVRCCGTRTHGLGTNGSRVHVLLDTTHHSSHNSLPLPPQKKNEHKLNNVSARRLRKLPAANVGRMRCG